MRWICVLAVLLAPVFAAAFPQSLRVQGALTNAAGDPATDGAYGATFAIYDGPDAGAAKLYSEAHPAIQVKGGVFTAVLGSVDAAVNPLPAAIFSSADDVFNAPANAWVHVATTYDGSTWTIYKDGVVVSTVANQPKLALGAGNCILLGEDADANCDGGGDTDTFDGSVDEFHVFTRALTAAEVAAVRDNDLGGKVSGAQIILADENTVTLKNTTGKSGDFRLVAATP